MIWLFVNLVQDVTNILYKYVITIIIFPYTVFTHIIYGLGPTFNIKMFQVLAKLRVGLALRTYTTKHTKCISIPAR